MLQPKKTKFRRMQKGRMKGIAQRGNQLAYGSFAIKALDSAWITGRQIEAARQAITRYMKREGQLCIRIFPDKPITKNLPKLGKMFGKTINGFKKGMEDEEGSDDSAEKTEKQVSKKDEDEE